MALVAGRDCTELIPSYHPFSKNPYHVLKNRKVRLKLLQLFACNAGDEEPRSPFCLL